MADAAANGVPADTPDADAAADAYGVDAISIEVWLVEGELRQIGYVFEREKAPYGGPDRTSVTYAWSSLDQEVEIEIPPPSEIED